ncbi:MAG: TetR/AcrR family transcriptional regulator [Deltaproteobacteria bacterium]|nr:TetR/AcrR family transcriptional regulator [Deltaproteobacteria bacterium]
MNKKQNLIDAAIRLFADQSFEGTSTIQLSKAAGVTEPLIYYHFDGKHDLFSHVLKLIFNQYFNRLDDVDQASGTEFEKIERVIQFHMDMVQKFPREVYLIMSGCPVKFSDPVALIVGLIRQQNLYHKNVKEIRDAAVEFCRRSLLIDG